MSVENKQDAIVAELKRRIHDGYYLEKFPKALELAEEFNVNFKTLNKAIAQLVEQGLVYRKTGLGTFIVKNAPRLEDSLVELLFVGSAEMAVHPFYNQMWRGILDGIGGSGFKLVLTMLDENDVHGGIKNVCKEFTPSAGKILIGTCNEEQIRRLKREKCPLVVAGGRPADPDVNCVYGDVSRAIEEAVDYLRRKKVRDIAYIGLMQSHGEHLLDLDKFYAYLAAIQKKGSLDSDLIENAPPLAKFGYDAMKKILQRKTPQAVLVAYDHLTPGVYAAIAEAGLRIPQDISVIGVDGINPDVVPRLTSIAIDRYEIGLRTGRTLVNMIRNSCRGRQEPQVIQSVFEPLAGESII